MAPAALSLIRWCWPAGLKEAAQLGVPLTNQEMANVLGRSEMKPNMHGTEPRPGFRLERQEHNGKPFWTVLDLSGSSQVIPMEKSKGFIPMGGEPMAARQLINVTPTVELPGFFR